MGVARTTAAPPHGVFVPFATDTPLCPAVFLERPNRFVAFVELDGERQRVHVPDPGRLPELMIPGTACMLTDYGLRPNRKTRYALTLIRNPKDTHWVCINTQQPNQLVKRLLLEGTLPGHETDTLIKAESKWGQSRFDFLVDSNGQQHFIEVKAVSLVDDTHAPNGRGLFPDAPTVRGTKHLKELIEAHTHHGYRATVLFVIQRDDAVSVEANVSTDPTFAATLTEACQAGVVLEAIRVHYTPEGMTVHPELLPVYT